MLAQALWGLLLGFGSAGLAALAARASGETRRRTTFLLLAITLVLALTMGNLGSGQVSRTVVTDDPFGTEFVANLSAGSRVDVEFNLDFILNGPIRANYTLTIWDPGNRIILNVSGVAVGTISTRTGALSEDRFGFYAWTSGTYRIRLGTPDGLRTSYNSDLGIFAMPVHLEGLLDAVVASGGVASPLLVIRTHLRGGFRSRQDPAGSMGPRSAWLGPPLSSSPSAGPWPYPAASPPVRRISPGQIFPSLVLWALGGYFLVMGTMTFPRTNAELGGLAGIFLGLLFMLEGYWLFKHGMRPRSSAQVSGVPPAR